MTASDARKVAKAFREAVTPVSVETILSRVKHAASSGHTSSVVNNDLLTSEVREELGRLGFSIWPKKQNSWFLEKTSAESIIGW